MSKHFQNFFIHAWQHCRKLPTASFRLRYVSKITFTAKGNGSAPSLAWYRNRLMQSRLSGVNQSTLDSAISKPVSEPSSLSKDIIYLPGSEIALRITSRSQARKEQRNICPGPIFVRAFIGRTFCKQNFGVPKLRKAAAKRSAVGEIAFYRQSRIPGSTASVF